MEVWYPIGDYIHYEFNDIERNYAYKCHFCKYEWFCDYIGVGSHFVSGEDKIGCFIYICKKRNLNILNKYFLYF